MLFRDTHVDAEGCETVVHEYALRAAIDPSTLRIEHVEATAHALPWVECNPAAASARRLLGRPVTITGTVEAGLGASDGLAALEPVMPIALPPDGEYAAIVGTDARAVRIEDRRAYLVGEPVQGRVSARLVAG